MKAIIGKLRSSQDVNKPYFETKIRLSIQNFLISYPRKISLSDFQFLPILGPIIAFIIQLTYI